MANENFSFNSKARKSKCQTVYTCSKCSSQSRIFCNLIQSINTRGRVVRKRDDDKVQKFEACNDRLFAIHNSRDNFKHFLKGGAEKKLQFRGGNAIKGPCLPPFLQNFSRRNSHLAMSCSYLQSDNTLAKKRSKVQKPKVKMSESKSVSFKDHQTEQLFAIAPILVTRTEIKNTDCQTNSNESEMLTTEKSKSPEECCIDEYFQKNFGTSLDFGKHFYQNVHDSPVALTFPNPDIDKEVIPDQNNAIEAPEADSNFTNEKNQDKPELKVHEEVAEVQATQEQEQNQIEENPRHWYKHPLIKILISLLVCYLVFPSDATIDLITKGYWSIYNFINSNVYTFYEPSTSELIWQDIKAIYNILDFQRIAAIYFMYKFFYYTPENNR